MCVFCVLLLQLMVTSIIAEVLIGRDTPIYDKMTLLRPYSGYWFYSYCGLPPTKVEAKSCSLLMLICFAILSCFMHMLYVRIISAHGRCVVVTIARNRGSTTTTNVFCRTIDDSGSGERRPFQLLKSENRSFWTNEEVTNEGIKIGCLLEYRVRKCWHSLLGGRDGKQFIFHWNASIEPRVSFHYYTNRTVNSRFFEKLKLSLCLSRFRSPFANLDPPAKLPVFHFSLYREFIFFVCLFVCFFNFTLLYVNSCRQPAFYHILDTQVKKVKISNN